MYKYLLVFFLALASAGAQDYCTITATVKLLDGKTPAIGAKVIVTRADRSGSLYANTTREYRTNTSGVATFTAPRTVGTDSAYINVRVTDATGMILSAERTVGVPNAATSTLEALMVANSYTSALVLIPALFAHAQSDSLQIYGSLAFSDAFQIRRDARGRVRVERDPDSSAASSGVSAATLKDSLNVEMSIGARLARRISDSLNANPRSNLFDTLNIHQRAHEWTAQQKYTASLADGASFVPITLQGWTNPDAGFGLGIQRNDFGLNRDYTFRIGYNPYRRNTTEPELVWQYESNYFNSDSLLEMHLAATGQNGSSSRGMTTIARRSTGRFIDVGFNAAKIYFGDSSGAIPQAIRIVPADRTIELDTSAALKVLRGNQTFITAYNGTTYNAVLGITGNTIIDYGGSGWTQQRFTAGTKTFTAHSPSGFWNLPNGSWSGAASDSLISASKGYVDTRIAAAGGISLATLTDSLNANPRRDNGKLNITALTDTLSANVTRGATIKADTASLAAIADQIYPRTAAGGASPMDTVLTLQTRSISSTARIFVADDSITFVGEAGDVIDASTGNVFRGTIGANDTLSVTNMVDGQVITVIITNASTYTLGWTGVNWAGGTAPTLSATANKRDAFTIIRAGGIMYGSYISDLR